MSLNPLVNCPTSEARAREVDRRIPQVQPTHELSRRKAMITGAFGLLSIGRLLAAEPKNAFQISLEKNVEAAKKQGLKLDYDSYQNHPSPFLADLVLRLVLKKIIKPQEAQAELNLSANKLALYKDDPKGQLSVYSLWAALLVDEKLDKPKKIADPQLGAFYKLHSEAKLDEAFQQLLKALKAKDLQ